jgi:hypothetical protein
MCRKIRTKLTEVEGWVGHQVGMTKMTEEETLEIAQNRWIG